MTNTPYEMSPAPGAATMCNPAVIKACAVARRAACLAGDPFMIALVGRAWKRGDAEILAAHLDGLAFALSNVEGAWNLWTECRLAAHAVRMSEGCS